MKALDLTSFKVAKLLGVIVRYYGRYKQSEHSDSFVILADTALQPTWQVTKVFNAVLCLQITVLYFDELKFR